MSRSGKLNRRITVKECPWLKKDLSKGKVVYEYAFHTYGCISSSGIAVSDEPDNTSFFEVPEDSVIWD